ncbi:MAG: DNA polymerase-3 subunit gamma/tau [Flavobacteriaceae bacterium]|jgi:DNA polymerase-3 subunit gamma/tau
MNTEVLYRKYRPATFTDVIGQDHIVSVLQSAIDKESPNHAYLFFGTRGTGKTSIARLVAQALGTKPEDIHEIDGASNRKIDDIRELRDAVHTLPFDSKYKVYIIDEVHMLTTEAFNALLKTLEEPPLHVIFILATTEVEKVPETIKSRCEVFTFRRPTEKILQEYVRDISEKEGLTISPEGVELISLLGNRSFRDTLSVLQKVVTLSKDSVISEEEIQRISGAPTDVVVYEYLKALISGDVALGVEVLSSTKEAGVEMRLFVNRSMMIVRDILLVRYSSEGKKNLAKVRSDSRIKFIEEVLEINKEIFSSDLLLLFLETEKNMRFAFISELPLEILLYKVKEQIG